MKRSNSKIGLFAALSVLVLLILGCGDSGKSAAEWTKSKRVAGSDRGLSHVSGVVVDDKFAWVVIGGTVADEQAGTNGVRKIDLSSGEVSNVDNGEKMPQSETGGIAADEKYVYWNAGGNILRISKDGGKPDTVASENVGIGIDMAVDNDNVYWANHGYYSPNSPISPSPVYSVPKKGGKVAILADQQNIPSNVVADGKFVYWHTVNAIFKAPKSGGEPQVVYQASDKEGIDVMNQDADNLYFGFRGAGESRWALRKVAKTGGDPVTLVKTFSLKPIVGDDQNIYFFDEAGMTADVLCKVTKSGGEVIPIDTGYSSGTITQTKTKVFFGSLDTIYSIDK